MSAQTALFAQTERTHSDRLGFLSGLNVGSPDYPRLAAERIATLRTARELEEALAEVPRHFMQFVETLTVSALAIRVARALDPRIKGALMISEVPELLRARVEPLAKSYAQIRPWEHRE